MPLGLNGFVHGTNEAHRTEDLTRKDLERRRALAAQAKITRPATVSSIYVGAQQHAKSIMSPTFVRNKTTTPPRTKVEPVYESRSPGPFDDSTVGSVLFRRRERHEAEYENGNDYNDDDYAQQDESATNSSEDEYNDDENRPVYTNEDGTVRVPAHFNEFLKTGMYPRDENLQSRLSSRSRSARFAPPTRPKQQYDIRTPRQSHPIRNEEHQQQPTGGVQPGNEGPIQDQERLGSVKPVSLGAHIDRKERVDSSIEAELATSAADQWKEHNKIEDDGAGSGLAFSVTSLGEGGLSRESSPSDRPYEKRRAATRNSRVHKTKISGTSAELDYDTAQLKLMKYPELKDQPFDMNPRATASIVPVELIRSEVTVGERLQHFLDHDGDHQAEVFSQMSMDQWEQAGDWFLDRFSDIVSDLKKARQTKRRIATDFEGEIAARHEIVEAKTDGFNKILKEMRTGGEGVLRGKVTLDALS